MRRRRAHNAANSSRHRRLHSLTLTALLLAATLLAGAGEARPNAIRLVVSIDWTMSPRFGLDENGNGLPDLRNTREYVNPGAAVGQEARFDVALALSVAEPGSTRRPVRIDSASWSIREENCAPRQCSSATARGDKPSVSLPEGVYEAAASFSGQTVLGQAVSGRVVRQVRVQDFLIVSIGDSYASGEGNPERIRRQSTSSSVTYDVFWADSGLKGETVATSITSHDRFAQVTGTPPGGYCALDRTQTMKTCFKPLAASVVGRDHARSHRSTLSASAQTALAIERADPRSSVTFVSVAASGATINAGLTGAYGGVQNEPGATPPRPKMDPQVAQVARLVDMRKIDALTISIGGNDIGFGNVVQALILAGGVSPLTAFSELTGFGEYRAILSAVQTGNWNAVDAWDGPLGLPSYDNIPGGGLNGVAALYDKLAKEIRAQIGTTPLKIGRIYITEYPDPTKWLSSKLKRHYCTTMLGGVAGVFGAPLGHIDKEEARWAYEFVLVPLNRYVANAAQRHGWHYVNGIAGAFGNGHGLCANLPYDPSGYAGNPYVDIDRGDVAWPTGRHVRWLRNARESELIQGPPRDRASSKGTLHPNEFGHRAISERLNQAIGYTPQAAPTAVEIVVP